MQAGPLLELSILKKSLLTFVLSTLAHSSLAIANDAETNLQQLMAMDLDKLTQIEVATGTPKDLAEAPAVISVVTEQDIKATGARTLSEALERVPGLHVSVSPFRLQKIFSIRGIQTDYTPQVLVLMDRTELNSLNSGSTPVSFNYPTSAIKRIEVIRGPGSAVYGADAFSGVINVITKKATDISKTELGVTLGSFDTFQTWFNGATAINGINLSLLMNYETSDGDDDRQTPYGPFKTEKDVQNIHFNVEGNNWSLTNWYYHIEKYMGNGAGIYANDEDKDITEVFKSKFEYNQALSDKLSMSYSASYYKSKLKAYFKLFPEGIWPVGTDGNLLNPPFLPVSFQEGVIGAPGADSTTYRANITSIYTLNSAHRIRVSAGYSTSDVKSNEYKNFGPGVLDGSRYTAESIDTVNVTGTEYNYLQPYDRDVRFLSLQDEWKINPELELTTGVRYDDYSDFGSTTNPRVALVWKTSPTVTTKFLFGSAFRVANATENSIKNNPANLGNPDIEPENITTSEIVFDYTPNATFGSSLNLYYYEAEDLIALDLTNTFQNIGEQEGKGIEVEANWQPNSNLSFRSNLSYQVSENPTTGEDIPLVPEFTFFLDSRYAINDYWQISMQNYAISGRKRAESDLRSEVKDYLKTDINLTYSMSTSWKAQLLFKNVFDESIKEPSPNSALYGLSGLGELLGIELPNLGFPDDYPMEGRAIYLTGTFTF